MRKFFGFLTAVLSLLAVSGCVTAPEYYEELTEAETKQLLHSARTLALQAKAMPDHMRGVFVEITPHQRIVYDGNKHGKASFRWEIYENAADEKKLTQRDINPYWVMVYAIGDLTDPEWKLIHAHENPEMRILNTPPGTGSSNNNFNAPRPVRRVRYKR